MPFIPWVLVVQTAHLSGLLICGQNIIEPWGNVIAFICCGNTIIIGSPTYNKNAFFVNGFGCGIFLRASQSIWILSKSFSKLLKFVTKTKLFWAWLERDISSHIELPLNSPQEKKMKKNWNNLYRWCHSHVIDHALSVTEHVRQKKPHPFLTTPLLC